jgi:hypothetical protein
LIRLDKLLVDLPADPGKRKGMLQLSYVASRVVQVVNMKIPSNPDLLF